MEKDLKADLCSIFYISRSTVSFTQVERIVATSRRNNEARDITGGMLFTGRYFAQILEGPRGTVMSTMLTMAADPRHENITPMWDRSTAKRIYQRWTMGFVVVPSADHIIEPLMNMTVIGDTAQRLSDTLLNLIESST